VREFFVIIKIKMVYLNAEKNLLGSTRKKENTSMVRLLGKNTKENYE